MNLHTLSITFNLSLPTDGLEAFRGALAETAGLKEELFHNHNNAQTAAGQYHQRYPLVHYRIHNRYAAVFGINEGAEAIDKLVRSGALKSFCMGGRHMPLEVRQRQENGCFPLHLSAPDEPLHAYRLYHYLPLTPENYQRYKALPDFVARVQMMEKLLANHIIAFARAVNWQFTAEQRLQVSIVDIDRVTKVVVMGTPMMCFDLVFSTNAVLPDRLAIGRKVAFGHGWFYRLPHKVEAHNSSWIMS